MNNKCLECGTVMEAGRDTHKYDAGGLDVTLLNVPVWRCPNCGEKEVEIQSIDSLNRLIVEDIVQQKERLGPKEIKFLRKYLGLASSDLAKKMHVDPSTVSRWERVEAPQVMELQADLLLRTLVLLAAPVEKYPIEEVATKEPKSKRRRIEAQKLGWAMAAA